MVGDGDDVTTGRVHVFTQGTEWRYVCMHAAFGNIKEHNATGCAIKTQRTLLQGFENLLIIKCLGQPLNSG